MSNDSGECFWCGSVTFEGECCHYEVYQILHEDAQETEPAPTHFFCSVGCLGNWGRYNVDELFRREQAATQPHDH